MKKFAFPIAVLSALFVVTAAFAAGLLSLPGVPVTVTHSAWNAGVLGGTLDITLSNVPGGFDVSNGTYLGWCIEDNRRPNKPANSSLTLFDSTNPVLPANLAGKPWDKINYLLNHKLGAKKDIQVAIWGLTGTYTGTFPITPAAIAMYNDANANGAGFAPAPGQVVAVIVRADGFGRYGYQDTMIEVRVPSRSTPTNTPTNTATSTPTDTATNTPTDTPTNTPTNTATNTPTDTPTSTPTNTATSTPTDTPTSTPTNTATSTPAENLCLLIRSPGFWTNWDNHFTQAQFEALIAATQDYSGLTLAQAEAILTDTGDQYHRHLLAAELNAAWNPQFGTAVYTEGSLAGMTVNQILNLAFNTAPGSASEDLVNAILYLGSLGEDDTPEECLLN